MAEYFHGLIERSHAHWHNWGPGDSHISQILSLGLKGARGFRGPLYASGNMKRFYLHDFKRVISMQIIHVHQQLGQLYRSAL